jgi:superfamily II DNA or RNA helicase
MDETIDKFYEILGDVNDFKSIKNSEKLINKHVFDKCSIKLTEQMRKYILLNTDDCKDVYDLLCDLLKQYAEDGKGKKYIIDNLVTPYKPTTDKKKLYINIAKELKQYIININLIDEVINQTNKGDVKEEDVIEYKKVNVLRPIKDLRENQKEVLKLLNKDGIVRGIHCQATGTGKSLEILMYCNYFLKNKMKGNIIIFTERCNIVADLFGFSKKGKDVDLSKVDENNKKIWKNAEIIDLNEFDIINRVTVKNPDWNKLMKKVNNKKPKILVINRAYLTKPELYETLTRQHVGLILHDECHNATSNLCYNMLVHFKDAGTKIVGFSATPLRAGKIKTRDGAVVTNIKRLISIYGKDNKLNILTNYNMIYAISKKLILPPKFYWYQLVNNENDDVLLEEWGIIANILSTVCKELPNQKIVAWCGTIKNSQNWLAMFKKQYKTYPSLSGFKFYIDHSQNTDDNADDYDKFKKRDEKCILFCANKHREGSDIRNLDCCVFLDKVNNRGSIPFIQSIGRVLRIDMSSENKKCGVIIDGLMRDSENYEKNMIDKIVGYYMSFENLSIDDDNEDETKYDKYVKLMDVVKFDKENNVIVLNLGGEKIKINCRSVEWKDIVAKFEPILQQRIKLSCDEKNEGMYNDLKELVIKLKIKSQAEYNKKCKSNDKLIKNPDKFFVKIWKDWYDFLSINIDKYPKTLDEWKKICKSKGIKNTKDYKKYYDSYGLPELPKEIYGFNDIDYELGCDNTKIIRRN